MFDEPHTLARFSCQVFPCNWILVLENTNDAHNAFFVHRNCVEVVRNPLGGRPRTPLGYRTKIVGGKTANYNAGTGIAPTERYYYDETGKIPYQMYYPGVDGVWPKHRYRRLWSWIWTRGRTQGQGQRWGMGQRAGNFTGQGRGDDAWQGTRLPSISAKGTGGRSMYRSHRWAVPIERDMTRIVYISIERYLEKPSLFTQFQRGFTWPIRNWSHNFNFRWADVDAERTCRYDIPEFLSPTDSTVVVIRKVLAEYGRGIHTAEELKELDEKGVAEERLVEERNRVMAEEAQSVHARDIQEGMERFESQRS
jgi:hypothetical protein